MFFFLQKSIEKSLNLSLLIYHLILIIKTNDNRVLPACWSVGRLSVPASLASADERTVAVICYWCGPPHYITADPTDVTEMSSDTEMAPYRLTTGV